MVGHNKQYDHLQLLQSTIFSKILALSGSVKSNSVCDLIPSATRTIALAVPFPNGTVTLSCETVVG